MAPLFFGEESMNEYQIRLTGVLIEAGQLLIVKQQLSKQRQWSLPGGRLESGESIADGMIREIQEETGLDVVIEKLLYVCDVMTSRKPLIHMTFLLKRTGGQVTLPSNEFDENPIADVCFVDIRSLGEYGFSERFIELIMNDFPSSGSYMGDKHNIGLGI